MPLVDAHSKVSQKGYGWHCFGRACHFIHCCLADKQTSHTLKKGCKQKRKENFIYRRKHERFSGEKNTLKERFYESSGFSDLKICQHVNINVT